MDLVSWLAIGSLIGLTLLGVAVGLYGMSEK